MFSLGSSLATSSELSQRRKLSIFRSERVIRTPNCSLCSVSASLTLTWAKPRLATLGLPQPEVAQEEADPAEISHFEAEDHRRASPGLRPSHSAHSSVRSQSVRKKFSSHKASSRAHNAHSQNSPLIAASGRQLAPRTAGCRV